MESIYLIHTREFVNSNKPIYRLGRGTDVINRINQYPLGSKVLFIMACNNSLKCEARLINILKTKFIHIP